ncbi:MAG: lipopolysaccharide kinase InaA family protein, partial [Desulfomonilia bacterium]|nr:lipopolysaccharide kinase InaA family protein [Desulfomonilia bacterium]
ATRPDLKRLLDHDCPVDQSSTLRGRGQLRLVEPDLVVRPLLHGGLLRHITGTRFLSLERSIRELEISEYLRNHGIRTPQILAIIITPSGIFRKISVVSELVPDSIDLLTWLETPRAKSPEIFLQAGSLIRQIHALGVFHADCHLKNFLLERDHNLWVLDLDKAHRFRTLPVFMQQMNFRRFVGSCRKWQKQGRIHLPPNYGDTIRN